MAEESKPLKPVSNWPALCWLTQLFFFMAGAFACVYGFYTHIGRIGIWYYFVCSAAVLTLTTLSLLFGPGLRQLIGLTAIIVVTYLIPFSVYAYGQPVQVAIAAGLFFVIIVMAITPPIIGFAILCAGITFGIYMKYYEWDLGQVSVREAFLIGLAYIGAAIVAYCWKSLIVKIYLLLSQATTGRPEEIQKLEVDSLRSRLDDINNERQLLKEEIALHIIEMKQITSRRQSTSN